MKRRRKPQNWT